jgi:hypothetical protein
MFRPDKQIKNTTGALIILLFSVLFWGLAYKGLRKQNIDLGTLDKITGEVEGYGTDYSGGKVNSQVFFVKFKNLYQVLGVYRKNKNYKDLIESVQYGDQLTAFFIAGTNTGKINTDLVQLEKNGRIILNKEEYEKKYRLLIYIGLIVGVVCAVLVFFQFKPR